MYSLSPSYSPYLSLALSSSYSPYLSPSLPLILPISPSLSPPLILPPSLSLSQSQLRNQTSFTAQSFRSPLDNIVIRRFQFPLWYL